MTYIFAVLVLFQFASVQFVLASYENASSAADESPEILPQLVPTAVSEPTVGLPVRLKIPKIKVNAPIDYVGVLADGSMGIPALPQHTAWYQPGPRPGEIGSAVIDGHLNWWYGSAGVFGHLKSLKKGDIVSIQSDRGETISFRVRATKLFREKDDATSIFTSTDGKAHLNLVTCDGVWVHATKAYSQRLVVFTDKIENTK